MEDKRTLEGRLKSGVLSPSHTLLCSGGKDLEQLSREQRGRVYKWIFTNILHPFIQNKTTTTIKKNINKTKTKIKPKKPLWFKHLQINMQDILNRATFLGNFLFKRHTNIKNKLKVSVLLEGMAPQKETKTDFSGLAPSVRIPVAVKNGSLIPPAHVDVNQGYRFLWIYLWANLLFSQDKTFVLGGMFIGCCTWLTGWSSHSCTLQMDCKISVIWFNFSW